MSSYVLGVDLGISRLKGILMTEEGELVAVKSAEYVVDSPEPGYSEQRPEYWLMAMEYLLTSLSDQIPDFGRKLVGISFSGQMHSLVVLDEEDRPIYPAILRDDTRATRQCQEIVEKLGDRILDITKNSVHESYTLPKILWLQEQEPEVWSKVRKIMLPKDFLVLWLTGKSRTDYSDAAGTLLFDVEAGKWSDEIANCFQIDLAFFPKIMTSTNQTGSIRPELRDRFNLVGDVKVFQGGGEGAVAALSVSLIQDDLGLISMGTPGTVSAYESGVKNYEGQLCFLNHILPERYYSMKATLALENPLDWFLATFGGGESFSDLSMDICTVPPGSDGLVFTPYTTSEQVPCLTHRSRGSFVGLSIHHDLRHFSKSVLEGISFSLRDSKEKMEGVKGKRFRKLLSIGGGLQSPEILQMQADIFDAEMICLSTEQGPGLGACVIAAYGCGFYSDLEEAIQAFVKYEDMSFLPEPTNVTRYAEIYQIWKEIYSATSEINHHLMAFDNK